LTALGGAVGESTVAWLVLCAVVTPVLAALASAFARGRGLPLVGAIAAGPMLVLGLVAPSTGVEVQVDWLLLGARFGVDAHSGPFALLTGTLWVAASIACVGYFDSTERRRIAPWWLLALTGSIGLVLALDGVTYFLFFALMSFASYGLVVHRGDADAFRAGRIYMWYVMAGEIALFAGLALSDTHPDVTAALLLVGFGIKAGALVLHSWLPLAHGAAPAPASAVLSGAMLKAGLLGWLRFVDSDAPWADTVGLGLVGLGMAGAIAGALLGIVQHHSKVVLAYSSVSQMGIVIAAFGMLLAVDSRSGAAACAAFALHHALAKSALFLGVGVLERLSGTARRIGLGMMAVPALGLVGVPFTSGAVAKAQIKALALGLPEPWAVTLGWALPVTAVGTALLMLRLFATLGGPRKGPCPAALWLPAVLLAAAGLAIAAAGGEPIASTGSLWEIAGAVVPAVLAVGILLGWRWLSRLVGLRAPRVQPGDIAAAIESRILAWASRSRLSDGSGRDPIPEPETLFEQPPMVGRLLRAAERQFSEPRLVGALVVATAAILFGTLAALT
jgi:hydrogenase-4 component B